ISNGMHVGEEQLKKFIKDSGLVGTADISRAEKKAKEKKTDLGELLVSEGKISEDDLRRMEAYVLGIPFVNLKNEKLDFSVLSLIPEPIARNHNIIAYRKNSNELEVAMLDTDDLSAIDFVKKKVGLKILPRLTDTESMKNSLLQYQKTLKAEFSDIIEKEAASLKKIDDEDGPQSEKDLKEMAEDLPIVRIVDTLLSHAIVQGASDIHIEPEETQVLVRYRIDGILRDAMVLPKETAPGITARIKVLSSLKLDEKRLPQDGRFKIEKDSERVSFRVSTLPTYYGEKTVMRLLRESSSGFTLEGLGFHGEDLEKLHHALNQSTGMILATGPTGSGKTTTLYTMLDILNTPDVNISTVEDPIEYQMKRVNQTQVKPDIGLTFGSGLRSLVRQDPDIIMVGEIRDSETVGLAINAALTGHLVLSTLHTNSAAGAVPRLIDMGAESFLLVSTINVIIAQRLVRRLSSNKEKYMLTPAEQKALSQTVDLDRVLKFLRHEKIVDEKENWNTIPLYKPKQGVSADDGYSGRIGIHEVMNITPTIKDMIIKGAISDDLEAQAKKEGMMTMLEDGIFKAAQGVTSIDEVLSAVNQ
ncbi:MAG: GspE/PulE family protein, partial [Patescibacteria group bacterium]